MILCDRCKKELSEEEAKRYQIDSRWHFCRECSDQYNIARSHALKAYWKVMNVWMKKNIDYEPIDLEIKELEECLKSSKAILKRNKEEEK